VDRIGEPPDLFTGVFGAAAVAGIFGLKIRFFPDKWPAPHGEPLSDSEADSLAPVDLEKNAFFQGILAQIEGIRELTGTAKGFLNWQGVLNTAFRLRGQEIFIDLLDQPARARHIFECVARTMIQGIKLLYSEQRKAGLDYRFASAGNCVVNMISPVHYRDHLLPFDQQIRGEFEAFGVHNCAWTLDAYMDAYAEIPDLGYIDMGIDSDLSRASELFPEARRNILYTSMDLVNKSEAEIHCDFERIANQLAPCDVGLPDIEFDVPDRRIRLAMDLCEQLSDRR
jgi:hypothetical protein